jgi:hypothetical protein
MSADASSTLLFLRLGNGNPLPMEASKWKAELQRPILRPR